MNKFLGEYDEIWVDDVADDIIKIGDYVKANSSVRYFDKIGKRWCIYYGNIFKKLHKVINIDRIGDINAITFEQLILSSESPPVSHKLYFDSRDFIKVKVN